MGKCFCIPILTVIGIVRILSFFTIFLFGSLLNFIIEVAAPGGVGEGVYRGFYFYFIFFLMVMFFGIKFFGIFRILKLFVILMFTPKALRFLKLFIRNCHMF